MSASEQALGRPAIEVVAKAKRRQFTGEYKRKIVREADGCKTPGAIGALLRREGLYSSHLTTWRAARERGELAGAPKKRGPARRVVDPRDKKLAAQERELTRWKKRAERAEALVELQKQVAAVLGTPLATEAPWRRRSPRSDRAWGARPRPPRSAFPRAPPTGRVRPRGPRR